MKKYSKLWYEIDMLSKREPCVPGSQFYHLVKDYCVSQASQIHQRPNAIYDIAKELETSSTFFRLLLDRIGNSQGKRRAEIFERVVLDAQQSRRFGIRLWHRFSQSTIADAPKFGVWDAVERFAGYKIEKPDSQRRADMKKRIRRSIKVWAKFIYPNEVMLNKFQATLSPRERDSHDIIKRILRTRIRFTGKSAVEIMKDACDPCWDLMDLTSLEDFLGYVVVSEALATEEDKKPFLLISSLIKTAFIVYDHVLGLEEVEAPLVGTVTDNFAPACPWLQDKEASRLPHYLWDLTTRKTRTTTEIMKEIGGIPRYVVISHTWGRWRIENQWVAVPGAKWNLPKITKFDVTRLPTMLEKLRSTTTTLGTPVEYVWLDLLTIPQTGNPELLKQEIANQAAIFALASHGFIWLNEVESWDRTEALLQWMSLTFVKEIIHSTTSETERNIQVDKHLSILHDKASSRRTLRRSISSVSRIPRFRRNFDTRKRQPVVHIAVDSSRSLSTNGYVPC